MEYSFGGETNQANVTGNKVAPVFKKDFPEVEAAVRVINLPQVVKIGGDLFEEEGIYFADDSFFEIFTFPFIAGNLETALDEPFRVVLTETKAKQYFGDQNPLGETIEIAGLEASISGIMQDPPGNTHIKPDIVVSFSSLPQSKPENETFWNANYATYFLLKNVSNIASLEAKIPDYMQQFSEEIGSDSRLTYHLLPLEKIHLESPVPGNFEPNGDMRYLYMLGIVAFLILLIAGTTYVNLATAASTERAKEVGIQKVLGAKRADLIGQHFGEAFIVTCTSVFLGLALVTPLLPYFNALFDQQLAGNSLLTPVALGGISLLGLALSLIAGFYPAMIVSGFKPTKVLKGQFKFTNSGSFLRKSLVVLQFGISILLIICTLVLGQQMNFIQNKNLGFDKEQIVVLPADRKVNAKYKALKTEFLQDATVQSVTLSYDSPVHIKGGYSISREIVNTTGVPVIALPVGEDFLNTMSIPLLAGKALSKSDHQNAEQIENKESTALPLSILINEAQVKAFAWTPEEAINQTVNFNGNRAIIKGVVQDFHFASLHETIKPLVIFPDIWGRNILVKIKGANIKSTLASMEAKWKNIASHRPFSYHFIDEEFDQMYAAEIQTTNVVRTFSWLAILLASLGLFGLASYNFVQRTKEIGVRKVLGASLAEIVALLSKDYLKLVLVALSLVAPIAWYIMDAWLAGFDYRIDIEWWVFLVAGIGAMLIAFLTISVQSIKAALVNPINSLKSE